jgi:hypothetical protein
MSARMYPLLHTVVLATAVVACARGSSFPTGAGGQSTGSTGGASSCAEQPCKLVSPQCGCAANEACAFAPGSTRRACEASGPAPAGQTCAKGECAPGSLCLGSGATGVCTEFCNGDADCANGICALQLSDGNGGSIPDENLCSQNCDPETNAGCVSGATCQVGVEASGAMRTFTICQGAGPGGMNAPCGSVSDCAATFDCVSTGAETVCLQYCYVDGAMPSGCASCTPLTAGNANTPIYLGSKQVGVCQ